MSNDENFLEHLKNKLGVQSESSSSCSEKRQDSLTKQESNTNQQEMYPRKGKQGRLKKKTKSMGPQMLNKLFKDIQANENSIKDQSNISIYREQVSELNLILKPKQNTQQNNHFEKINQKVTYMRNRRSFQFVNTDAKYQKHIIEKVQDLKDVDEVQIEIQAPEIFGGKNKKVDNALYWKNVLSQKPSSLDQKSISNIKPIQHQKKPPQKYQNRNQLFNQMNQQVKKRKSIVNTQVDQCFKKSSFNDLQLDLQEFDLTNERRNSNLLDSSFKENNSRYSVANSKLNKSNSKIHQYSKKHEQKISQIINLKQDNKQKIKNSTTQTKQKTIAKQNTLEIKQQQSELDEISQKVFKKLKKVAGRISERKQIKKAIKEKKKNKNGQKKQKKKKVKQNEINSQQYIKNFFEEEAEDSDIEGFVNNNEEDYDGVLLDAQLVEMIDNSVCFKESDEKLARRKYIQDLKLQDEKLIEKIKNSIFGNKLKAKKQITDSQRKRRRRMKEAANKYEQQDKKFLVSHEVSKDIQFKDCEQQSSHNSVKLKQLEKQYGIKENLNQPIKSSKQLRNPKLQVGLLQMNGFINQNKKKQIKKRGLLTQNKTSITAFRIENSKKKKSKSNKKPQSINIFNCSFKNIDE